MTPDRCDGIVLAAGAGTRYGMPKVLAEDGAWLASAVHALRVGGCARVFVVLGATGPAHRLGADSWLVSRDSGIALPAGTHPVWARDWGVGVSASMRAGLAAAAAVPALESARADGAADTLLPAADAGSAVPSGRSGGSPVFAAGNSSTGTSTLGITSAGNSRRGNSGPAGFVAIMPVDTPDVGPEVVARVVAAARESPSGLARAVFGRMPGHPVVLGRGHWAAVSAAAAGNSGAGTYLRQRADMVCVTCDDLATGMDQDYPTGGAR
ncbi:NTP transferase domain-containing protein [Nocardia sp. NPDC088792]|uniref:NTP transferase domain-containing protein n=1 Tax=Nocardia sp. NPDC088792 TaxID=3364332 RepID=UPI003810443B